MKGASSNWFISTPYIDAYQTPHIVNYQAADEPEAISFSEFEKRMESQAYQWGESSIGRAALSALQPAMLTRTAGDVRRTPHT